MRKPLSTHTPPPLQYTPIGVEIGRDVHLDISKIWINRFGNSQYRRRTAPQVPYFEVAQPKFTTTYYVS